MDSRMKDDSIKLGLATRLANRLINECVASEIVTEDEGNAYFDILVDGLMQKTEQELVGLLTTNMEILHG